MVHTLRKTGDLSCAGQRVSMEQQAEQLQTQLAAQGASLSERRRGAAGYLRTAVEAALSQLCMAGSRFDVRIGWELLSQVPLFSRCSLLSPYGSCKPAKQALEQLI